MDTGPFTSTTLVLLWSVIQSFALEYLWFVKDWYGGLDVNKKRTVHAGGVFVIALGAYLLSLVGVINAFTPDFAGAVAALTAFFAALGVSTGIHLGTKRSLDV